jgi:hypothetical protein
MRDFELFPIIRHHTLSTKYERHKTYLDQISSQTERHGDILILITLLKRVRPSLRLLEEPLPPRTYSRSTVLYWTIQVYPLETCFGISSTLGRSILQYSRMGRINPCCEYAFAPHCYTESRILFDVAMSITGSSI